MCKQTKCTETSKELSKTWSSCATMLTEFLESEVLFTAEAFQRWNIHISVTLLCLLNVLL